MKSQTFCNRQFLKIFFTFFIISTSVIFLNAQRLDHVQGELIIHLNEQIKVDNWATEFNRTHTFDINIKKRISSILDLYVVSFDFTKTNEKNLLMSLLRDKDIVMAQYNHFVELRSTIPDDPQFNDQWQYINTGQGGGTPEADIDMDLAWDISTGGVTIDGDTIVVCIIDDGIDGNHPDIVPNLFLNYAEIPGNGIDDDNNGFIDDIRGWSTSKNNDNVYTGGGHGTSVTGIVGAKGNNNLGVAGVNWDVKLMIVQGGTGVESEVLEAYSYPLIFRKKYNESNGEEGAFVVSTNASWGINQGQPDDAPLWCAFYDTLGKYGILNCGATANAAFDIDVVGDLPTACASDHMISVTNMNRFDNKVPDAGWGTETIDLGAFGAETWTTSFGSGYGAFGGTSGATPHVTGAIALLYSIPCPNILALAKSDPEAAAVIVKQAIMEGTDENISLEGITVSGGRLNVYNSMQVLLNQYCGDCPLPYNFLSDPVDENSVSISWTTNDSINQLDLQWREVGNVDWNHVSDVSSPFAISELDACTEYELQLKAYCNMDTIDYGNSFLFISPGCCVNPEMIEITEILEDQVSIDWEDLDVAISFNIRYRTIGSATWTSENTIESNFTITSFDPCEEIEVQIQTVCNLSSPDFTESVIFFSKGCTNPCIELPYCEISGFNATEEWISSFSLNSLVNITGSDDGYGSYLDGPTTDLLPGGTYNIEIQADYSGQEYSEIFFVWVDFDQDGVFSDAEILFQSAPTANLVSGEVSIPDGIPTGNTRMRVEMRFDLDPISCVPETFSSFGEVEDYCINITCPQITEIEASNITDIAMDITWLDDPNITDYEFRYKKVTESDWITINISEPFISLTDLIICTEYEVQAKATCSNLSSDFSESFIFTTACTSSTPNINPNVELLVYPIPFVDKISLDLTSPMNIEACSIDIYNQLGQIVLSIINEDIVAGENQIIIETQSLASGIYMLKVRSDEGLSFNRKIIKVD